MDLNEKIAARRAELALEEERQRLQHEALQREEERAKQEAAEIVARDAAKASEAAEQVRLSRQASSTKVVDLDGGMALFGQAVERITKRQMVLIFCMAGLTVVSLTQDMTKALLWAVGGLGYLAFILNGYANDIKKSNKEP
ncbi:hypothetical protein [Acidovorax sp. FG27]|uniref:hypothetical protein n=1 Tax=Acidovorax sp. FG27 TaxID=3133652 RepID=UPI0030EACD3C